MGKENTRGTEDMCIAIDGKSAFVNDLQAKVWFQYQTRVRREARKTHSCGQPDYRKCKADCNLCRWQQNGILLHYDAFSEKWLSTQMHESCFPSAENMYCWNELLQEIYAFSDTVVDKGSELLCLRMVECKTIEEIACMTGLPYTTVRYRLEKLTAVLRTQKNYFLD